MLLNIKYFVIHKFILKPINVFVDTQIFIQYKFCFNQKNLKRLLELGSSGSIQIILTETVIGEVRLKIINQIKEAEESLKNFHKLFRAVEDILPECYQGLRSLPKEGELIALAIKAWENYIFASKAIVLPASAANGADLLALYFGSKPPFSSGKKKSEFPDAISLLSIAKWLKTNQSGIYVVSQDNDLANWCKETPNASCVKLLPEFINLVTEAEDDKEKLVEVVRKLCTKEEQWLIDAIRSEFHNSGFIYTNNWEAEIDDVDVYNVSIHEVNIIQIVDATALVSLTVEIDFSAQITGPDFVNGIWDSEDKEYFYLPTFNIEHKFKERYEVSLEFRFSSEAERIEQILDIKIDDGSDISLSIDDDYS